MYICITCISNSYIVKTLLITMNKKISDTLWHHTCGRCEYDWTSRNENPAHCSKCASPYWNKKRVRSMYQAP